MENNTDNIKELEERTRMYELWEMEYEERCRVELCGNWDDWEDLRITLDRISEEYSNMNKN